MLVLTAAQTAHLLYRDASPDAALRPRRLADGRYALPESVLKDPHHSQWWPLLRRAPTEKVADLKFQPPIGGDFSVFVDRKEMYLVADPSPGRFDIPGSDLYRFEVHQDDVGFGGDPANGNRRSELVSDRGAAFAAGQTLWTSWSTVLTDRRDGFRADGMGIIHQWHSVDKDYPRSPVFTIGLRNGELTVNTRSHDGPVVHYAERFSPPTGQAVKFVVSGRLGAAGHIRVWVDGRQIVDDATPVGYYNDDKGKRALAYPHWGNYSKNLDSVDVIYHANMEWGIRSLSRRITSPLPVTTPTRGWI